MKKALLWSMLVVFVGFVILLRLGLAGLAGLNLAIGTAVVLIALFLAFVAVSMRNRED